MMVEEVQNAGYGVSVTPTRLVVRSPYDAPETYIEDVSESRCVKTVMVMILILILMLFLFFPKSGERCANGGL